jgi:voltage-gated potassium channel
MASKLMAPQKISNSQERFLVLIGLITGLLVIVPILNRFIAARMVLDLFLTAIAISMVYAVSSRKRNVIVGSLLAILMLSSMWLQYFHQNKTVAAAGMIAGILFMGVVIANFLTFMFKAKEVTRELIYASLLLYLLAALMWAFIYTFLALIEPASFNIPHGNGRNGLLVFQYYSFVTISTLGYGDITPVTEVAKAFSALEAITGQLYLVVVVAWLVGTYRKPDKEPTG